MSGTKHTHALPALLAAWLLIPFTGNGQTVSRLSTRFLARGEKALLEVSVTGTPPTAAPEIPMVPGLEIHRVGQGAETKLLPGRRLEYVFEYLIASYETGSHVLPAIEVTAGGVRSRTEPLDFMVFNPDDLQWSEAVAGAIHFRYASTFRVMNPHPYEGETTPVEIKIYVPEDLFVEDWGIPDFQRDGVTSWRFQPSAMRGRINLLGMPYASVAYPSTLTSTRPGKVGIGPANVRLITTQVVMDGVLRRISQEVNLAVPKLELETMPLPGNAPEGFENAIGSFRMDVSTALTEVEEEDPIPVEIQVTGSGNLDTLHPPKPVDATGWKVYENTTEQRGDERRELSGKIIFHQFMRPLELKAALPPFRLVYFDPKDQSYKTLTSEPIQLRMKPAKPSKTGIVAPPQALPMPVERMTDILAVLQPPELTVSRAPKLPPWIGHALGGLLALVLIVKALWMRHGYRFHRDPVRRARIKALREVERLRNVDDTGFLMSAGRFIESWLGANPSPEVKDVLAERDTFCFRPEKPAKSVIGPKRRDEILRLLRKSAMLWSALVLFGAGTGRTCAAEKGNPALEAYDSARYDEAIKLWLKAGPYDDLAPDTLYNIGNACYRAGSPGQAALYYRRALSRDPGHQESRQNLRFIERKYGSITVHRPDYQYVLAKIPLSTWKGLLWGGAWLCAIAALMFPASRPGAGIRLAAVAALVIGPLLAACGCLGWRYFPDDAEFAPVARQAVIVGDKTVIHVDAARTSPEVIDAPPGSLCEVIRESGRWAYVAFATRTRGWVPAEAIEKILPPAPPVPPTIHKPKADGKSA